MAVAATGFFDGVHVGHRKVINRLVSIAHERGEESIVVTFWPHPRNVLQQEARSLRLLSSMQEKKRMLEDLGVDRVEVIPFSREFGALTMEQYIEGYMAERFGVSAIVLGYDNRMGCDCCSAQQAAAAARKLGLEAFVESAADPVGGMTVSSTKIRQVIADGNVSLASEMLGYDYQLYGVVVSGNRLGRTIGFPTANMQLYEPLKQLPGNGAYFVTVETSGRTFTGMCNVGVRPTLANGTARTIETNILDFDEEIYGLDIRLAFRSKLRDEKRFDSLAQLGLQLEKDKEMCRKLAGSL